MTTADITDTRGAEMFARYACAPNQLGYCGPQDTRLLMGSRDEIEQAARQFTGAWPYLKVMSKLTDIPDPLDHRLVDSYWLGGGIGAELSHRSFTAELLKMIAPQAGHYWSHLTEDLVDEAAPNHCFHVFGVYPWSRLLGKSADEHPLSILDNCRISWGTVVSTDGTAAVVSSLACAGSTRCCRCLLPRNARWRSAHEVTFPCVQVISWHCTGIRYATASRLSRPLG